MALPKVQPLSVSVRSVALLASVLAATMVAWNVALAEPPLRPVESGAEAAELSHKGFVSGLAADGEAVAEAQPLRFVNVPDPPPFNFHAPLSAWSVTDRFGAARLRGLVHGGIDLAPASGSSPVLAACSGMVASSGYDAVYGYSVSIDCGSGWSALVAHLATVHVWQGWPVSAGDVLGLSGSTGVSTGEHVHFEIRRWGLAMNPELFIDFGIPPGTPLSTGFLDESLYEALLGITPTPQAAPSETPTPTGTPAEPTPAPTDPATPGGTTTASPSAEPTVPGTSPEPTQSATPVETPTPAETSPATETAVPSPGGTATAPESADATATAPP